MSTAPPSRKSEHEPPTATTVSRRRSRGCQGPRGRSSRVTAGQVARERQQEGRDAERPQVVTSTIARRGTRDGTGDRAAQQGDETSTRAGPGAPQPIGSTRRRDLQDRDENDDQRDLAPSRLTAARPCGRARGPRRRGRSRRTARPAPASRDRCRPARRSSPVRSGSPADRARRACSSASPR